METVFVTKNARIERQDSTLLVRTETTRKRFPIETVRHMILLGEAGLTTAVLALCGRSGVRVTVLDWHGNVAGSFDPFDAPQSGHVRLAQARAILDEDVRSTIAREIVAAAIDNILANLRYRLWRGNDALAETVERIARLAQGLPRCATSQELMGIEGNVRAAYYEAWPLIDTRLAFTPRRRRPPNNRINCLISWFNGLAYAALRHEIGKTHLDPALSFLHSANEARHSLSLDLSESFKPVLVDTLIFKLVLRDQLADNWFAETQGVCRLTEAGRQATLESWVAKLETSGADALSMRDRMRKDALALERHVLGIAEFKAFRRGV